MMDTRRRFIAATVLSTSLLSTAYAQPGLEIGVKEGLLSVNASNVPVMQLADALGRELGITVIVQGDTTAAISAEISDEPVEKAIAKLSPNHMLVHASKALDAEILEVVLIIADGGTQAASGGEFLPSGAPADEIVAAQPPPNPAAALPEVNPEVNPEGNPVGQLRDKMRRLNSRIVGAGDESALATESGATTETPNAQQ